MRTTATTATAAIKDAPSSSAKVAPPAKPVAQPGPHNVGACRETRQGCVAAHPLPNHRRAKRPPCASDRTDALNASFIAFKQETDYDEAAMTLAFDTLKAVKALRNAGFDEAQAEAVVETVGDAMVGNVASKTDLQQTEARLLTETADLRSEFKTEISALKADLYKQLWLMGVGIVAVTVTLVKLI